jgi:hypothetical protein
MAQAFDPARGQLKGDPHPVAQRVSANLIGGLFSVSENGILIYLAGGGAEKRLTWFDRSGKNLGVIGEVADYFDLRVSPDGQKLASNGKWQISVSGGRSPRWRRDSKEIFYLSPTSQMMAAQVEEKGNSIVVGTAQALFRSAVSSSSFAPYDVNPDGKKFVINVLNEGNSPLTLLVNWTAKLNQQ